jgi:hypothetical protein
MRPFTEGFSRRSTIVTVVLLVLVAIGLRGYRLGALTLWVDEAESAVNALTIVADGVPGSSFLGQPLYENTLVRPWPESDEYEFRDLSYSDRGLAVYHSWLPLYSIAAAFRLAGVTPEAARSGTPLRDASQAEIEYWTIVPRLPAVALGALSVIAAWALGRRTQGDQVAIAMAFAVATSDFFVYVGRQARYYSASVAGSTLCGLAIWNAWRRGRLSDHALAGLAVGVLFHIHSVSAVAMSALYVAAAPMGRHQPRLWLRVATAGSVGALLVLPWAAWSGLLSQADWTPSARGYIDRQMVLSSLPGNLGVWGMFAGGLVWFIVASRPINLLSDRWRRPILDSGAAMCFAIGWLFVSYLSFFLLMPAASFFPYRLNLMVAVPFTLAASLVIAAMTRAVRPASKFLPLAGITIVLVSWNELPPPVPRPSDGQAAALIAMVRDWELGPGGRIFASPNEHLVLTYYSGRPVQSIAPVRREWLDGFANDLIILESSSYNPIMPAQVQETARRQGLALSEAEAVIRGREAVIFATVRDLAASGVSVAPPRRPPDALDDVLTELVGPSTRETVRESLEGTPLGRSATPANWHDFRTAFFYWFSNPARRTGPELNYRACRAEARATVLPNGSTLFDCRITREPPLVPAGGLPGELTAPLQGES